MDRAKGIAILVFVISSIANMLTTPWQNYSSAAATGAITANLAMALVFGGLAYVIIIGGRKALGRLRALGN